MHDGARSILTTLVMAKLEKLYEMTPKLHKKFKDVVETYALLCVENNGVDKAVTNENVEVFVRAVEQVFGDLLDGSKSSTTKSTSNEGPRRLSFDSEPSPVECRRRMSSESDVSITVSNTTETTVSSVHTSDSETTTSIKKVKQWKQKQKTFAKKQIKTMGTPRQLPPGVMWHKTRINPDNAEKAGLKVIHEHVMEDHIRAFETALDAHEVELVNEMRAMKGEPEISSKSCVVVNNCVYTTGGPAIFHCVMETHNGCQDVVIYIHVNKSTRGIALHRQTFVAECVETGVCLLRHTVASMRFWKELGTATICMQYRDQQKQNMAPTAFFHLESISHCRLFAKELHADQEQSEHGSSQ